MAVFWKDRKIEHQNIEKKDITHNRRIVYYIESFLFPKQNCENGQEIEAIINLEPDEIFVLLCSVYLHDYGKGQFRLTLPHLKAFDNALYEKIQDSRTTATSLDIVKEYSVIEKHHSYNLMELLQLMRQYEDEVDFIEAFNEKYEHNQKLADYVKFVAGKMEKELPDRPNAGAAQKWIFRQLWLLNHTPNYENKSENFLEKVRLISCAHKPYSLLRSKNAFGREVDLYDKIKNERVSLLASLLRLADNLDFTQARVAPDDLKEFMNDRIKEGASKIEEGLVSTFAVWLKFMLV